MLPDKKPKKLPSLSSAVSEDFITDPIIDEESISLDEEFDEEIQTQETLIPLDTIEDEPEEELHSNPMEFNDEPEEDKYINKKKRKIFPFGGKKSKIKVNDFDNRKNRLTTIKLIRAVVMLVIVVLFSVGIKNTFFPSHVYTKEDIQNFAQTSIGETGFPSEAGAAFVEDFMTSYLTIDLTNKSNQELLSYFYTGEVTATSNPEMNMSVSNSTRQKLIGVPRVYDVLLATENSAVYKVSALVTDTTGEESNEQGTSARWLAFSVNVFYDEETGRFAVLPNNPTLIPKYEIIAPGAVPKGKPLGNGQVNNEMTQLLTPTIDGFVKAYSVASVKSHNEILQYIPTNPDYELYSGFGGSVEVAPTSSAITKTVYDTDIADEYKVLVNVQWVDVSATQGDNKVTYNSEYVMTVAKTNDGKYVVTAFRPFTYIMAEE